MDFGFFIRENLKRKAKVFSLRYFSIRLFYVSYKNLSKKVLKRLNFTSLNKKNL